MRRTKEWWARLSERERSELVMLERTNRHGRRSAYIPDDCFVCGYCGEPSLTSSLCPSCSYRLKNLIEKASRLFQTTIAAFYIKE